MQQRPGLEDGVRGLEPVVQPPLLHDEHGPLAGVPVQVRRRGEPGRHPVLGDGEAGARGRVEQDPHGRQPVDLRSAAPLARADDAGLN